jgi:hypothetical protein
MSNFQKMKLSEAIPWLEKLFDSFGIRSMVALQGNEWINILTLIQLTRRNVKDLNNEYRLLEKRLGKIDCDTFKITFQAKPIQDLSKLMSELQSGTLQIGDIRTKLLTKNPQAILDQGIGYAANMLEVGEYSEYKYFGVTMGMENQAIMVLYSCNISASSFGIRDNDDLARSWLGVNSLQNGVNIQLVIPIYATAEIQYQGGSEIKAMLKMDQRLGENSCIWLARKPQWDYSPILERARYEALSCENTLQDGFIYVTLSHKFQAVNVNDRISVSLTNDKLGELARGECNISQMPREDSDPFLKTFTLFDAGKNMENHLLNPKKPEDLVNALSWMLEMLNFSALQLGRDERISEEKTEKGSADIIACYSEANTQAIVVVDCTIGVPDEHKIDRIKNTAEYVSRKIGLPVKPVIVTSEKSEMTKEAGKKHAVKIVDSTDLEKMIGFYKKGYIYPAQRVILGD